MIFCRKDFFAEKNARAFAEVEERMRRTLEITDVAVEDEADGEDKSFPLFNLFHCFPHFVFPDINKVFFDQTIRKSIDN